MPVYCIECLAVRFWAKVDRTGGPDACWPWVGSRNPYGYGDMSVFGRNRRATHIAWLLTHGVFPAKGQLACHRCDNPPCCNPGHLFLGTPQDNTQDMRSKGRHRYEVRRGELNNHARLTVAKVLAIRNAHASGTPVKVLAAEHGVTIQAIYYVVRRTTWKHVP